MLRRCCLGVCLCAALLTTGCVLPDQLSQVQKDLADVQQRLRIAERQQREVMEKLEAVDAAKDEEEPVGRSEFADLKLMAEENSRALSVLGEQVNQTNRRLDRLSNDVQESRELSRRLAEQRTPPATVELGPDGQPLDPSAAMEMQAGAGEGAVPDPEALYNAAYADFSKGNYALAISGFEEYTERFPGSDLADNAMYWVGECYFSQGSFSQAVEAFDNLLEAYPESDRAAGANLKKGLAFLEQNEIGKAIVQLRYVMTTYGTSDEARIARDKLVSLGAPVR